LLAGILRLQSKRTGREPRLRWLPKGGSDALLQLSLFVMADILYRQSAAFRVNQRSPSTARARSSRLSEHQLFLSRGSGVAMGRRALIDHELHVPQRTS
jgi:hypothetical protein